MTQGVTLVGDGIENPANAATMVHASAMFGAACRFRDTKRLAESVVSAGLSADEFLTIASPDIPASHSRIIAFDNLPGAREVYGFQAGKEFAVLVGNERRGLSHEFVSLATDRVHVPMESRQINCLNVAAASAVALYYLCGPPGGPMAVRRDPRHRRPEILLLAAGDHFELGSTVRSAAAFGWERAFVEDRHQVWFGCDRAIRSEGRAAARRGRNDILLIPCLKNASHAYPRATVITRQPIGIPLHRANLAGGPGQLVIIPDESRVDLSTEDWSRLGRNVDFVHLQLPVAEFPYHYRLTASIALAEISRQVGGRSDHRVTVSRRGPIYDRNLEKLTEGTGVLVGFKDLMNY